METFRQYLAERAAAPEAGATLIFHKLISMLDQGHVDFTETNIKFNVGALVKDSAYNNLNVMIRKGTAKGARLGRHRTDQSNYIVIETEKLPERLEIDSFLERSHIAKSFISAMGNYIKNHHVADPDAHKTGDEMKAKTNTPERFEEIYAEIVKSVDEAITKYHSGKDEAGKAFEKFNIIKQETRKATHSLVQKEYFGDGESGFVKKFMSANSDAMHLDKDMKAKLESRLKSLYLSKIKPLL